MKRVHLPALVLLSVSICVPAQMQAPAAGGAALRKAPADASAAPESASILGAARAGSRIVCVGARGMVLLSDDQGRTWRQAKSVPVRSTLNAVSFADSRAGWAVGHNGTILATLDGGENWSLQRFDALADRPLFSVHFLDPRHGVAVGLWSLLLSTSDGGATWSEIKLAPPPGGGKADRNLFRIFADPTGVLYIAAERGTVLRSRDGGTTWTYQDTGYKGSLWTGVAAEDGTILVGGLRGSLYRSTDHGATWRAIDSGTRSSLTDIVARGRDLMAVGLDGTVTRSSDAGVSFKATQRDDRLALTALVAVGANGWQMFSKQGVVKP
jgi:photosystem II stability/assembly factor-like uncharacterized protein